MIAATWPAGIVRSMPFRIALPATLTCRFSISSMITLGLSVLRLTDAAFQADADELLRPHGELHRQLLQDVAAESVDDHRDCFFRAQAALATVEELVVAD